MVREKLFQRLYDEIPYVVQFVRTAFRLASDGALLVKYNIVVPDSNVRIPSHFCFGSACSMLAVQRAPDAGSTSQYFLLYT